MRIAILGTRGIPAAYGGFETFAEELSTRLVDRGFHVTVYCEGDGKDGPRELKGVELRYVPTKLRGSLATVLFDVMCFWNARKEFDVVYMLGYGAAPFAVIPRLWRTTVWLNVDGVEWRRAKWGLVARIYFRLMEYVSTVAPSRVIADADAIRTHLRSRHGGRFQCSVIPYGARVIDTPCAVPENFHSITERPFYLVVCRLEPENHVIEIIRGYLASNSPYPLVIVGNHKAASAYTRDLLRFRSDKVRFIGTVFHQPTLEAIRASCRAYVHGHSVGGTNPSLLEAMGCGSVVAAHDNAFNREVVGEAGLFFRTPEDLKGIFEHLDELSDAELHQLREQGKARINQRYSWDQIVSQYVDLIEVDRSPK